MSDTTFVDYNGVVNAAWLNDVNKSAYYGVSPIVGSGTASAYTGALSAVPNAVTNGAMLLYTPSVTCAASATLEITNAPAPWNTALPVKFNGLPVAAGTLTAGFPSLLVYSVSGACWEINQAPVPVTQTFAPTVQSQITQLSPVLGSVATLRLFPKTDQATVSTVGHTTQLDGGAGTYSLKVGDTSGWRGTATISGTTLTLVSATDGALAVGQALNLASTGVTLAYITAGSGTSWTVSASLTYASATAFTCDNNGSYIVAADGGRWFLEATAIRAAQYGFLTTATAVQNASSMLAAMVDGLNNGQKVTVRAGSYQMNSITINASVSASWKILHIEGETETTAEQSYTDADGYANGVLIETSGVSAFTVSMDSFSNETVRFENIGFRNSGAVGSTSPITITQNSTGFPRGVQLVNIASSNYYANITITTTTIGVNGFGTMLFDRVTSYTSTIGALFIGAAGTIVMVDLLTIRNCLFHSCSAGGLVMQGTCPVYATLQDTHFEGCEPAGIITSANATTLNLINVSAESTGTTGSAKGIIDASLTGELILNVSNIGYGFVAMPQEFRLKRFCTINASSPVNVSGYGWVTNTPEMVTPVVSNAANFAGQTDLSTFGMCPANSDVVRTGARCFEKFQGWNSGAGTGVGFSSDALPDAMRSRFVGVKPASLTPAYNITDTFTAPSNGYIYSSWLGSYTFPDDGLAPGSEVVINGVDTTTLGNCFGPYVGNFVYLAPIAAGQVLARCSLGTYNAPQWMTGALTTFEAQLLPMSGAACGYPNTTTDLTLVATGGNVVYADYGDGATPFALEVEIFVNGGQLAYWRYIVNGDGATAANKTYTALAAIASAGISIATANNTNPTMYYFTVTNTTGSNVTVTKRVRYIS